MSTWERAARATARRLGARRAGQSLVEYGLIVALIAVVAIVGLQLLGNAASQLFQDLASSI